MSTNLPGIKLPIEPLIVVHLEEIKQTFFLKEKFKSTCQPDQGSNTTD